MAPAPSAAVETAVRFPFKVLFTPNTTDASSMLKAELSLLRTLKLSAMGMHWVPSPTTLPSKLTGAAVAVAANAEKVPASTVAAISVFYFVLKTIMCSFPPGE
jgi:hypothetical protein